MNIGIIFGTRPEAIKLIPIIREAQKRGVMTTVINTGQHKELLHDVLDAFQVTVDSDLAVMTPNQTLSSLTSTLMQKLQSVIDETPLDLIIVQGDTTTALVGAMVAFYNKIPVAHVEAGLRSGNPMSPFPEEMNRKLIGQIATFHFAPTKQAVFNLAEDGITKHVFQVGNTVIDALLTLANDKKTDEALKTPIFNKLDPTKRLVLMTCHRRENFGAPFQSICEAVMTLAGTLPECQIVYPVHPNPNIKDVAHATLVHPNIHLIEPVSYPELVALMEKSYLILTDSGGIQEEAPSLGKPVLVMRENTERPEGIEAGTATLVGQSKEKIIHTVSELWHNEHAYQAMATAVNPYGDGTAAKQIVGCLTAEYACI